MERFAVQRILVRADEPSGRETRPLRSRRKRLLKEIAALRSR